MSITIKCELWERLKKGLFPQTNKGTHILRIRGWKLQGISCSNDQTNSKSLQGGNNYYNPDPLVRLISKSNEMTVLVEGQNCTALLDSGAQVCSINIHLGQKLGLEIHKLQTMLNLEERREEKFHTWVIPSWSCGYQRLGHSRRIYYSSLSKTAHLGTGF